jgi:ion channel-forming bestrophin family protein
MIVPHRLHVWKLVRYIAPALGILFAYDMLVVLLFYSGWTWISLPHIPLSLFGTAIGVILGFRNNTAYQRWWEARILWGAIVNSSRSLARQTLSLIVPADDSPAERDAIFLMQQRIVQHQVAYVHALGCHLRGQNPFSDLQAFLPEGELESLRKEKNVPLAIQQRIALLLRQCYERNWIDSMRWADLDSTLSALMNSQGGAERIKNTPLPVQYDHYPKIAGLVANLGIFTPIGSALVGLIFLALDRIGRDLELPFENEINDIPMHAISRTIEINLKQLLGDSELPDPIQPVHGILW